MGVIQDGYYYPSAEEYHLGMEGEINWSRGYSNKYHSTIIRLTDGEDDYEGCLLDNEGTDVTDPIQEVLEACVWDRHAEMRVPLLTREEIEKEGWTEINPIYGENFTNKFQKKDKILDFKKGWVKIKYKPINLASVFEQPNVIYNGPCPTINHLRQIMRLLNIK